MNGNDYTLQWRKHLAKYMKSSLTFTRYTTLCKVKLVPECKFKAFENRFNGPEISHISIP